mgnify:FL=1
MSFSKDYSKIILIFFIILFLYFFSLNIYQMHDQHWTAIIDQDIRIIYNSLLISSGFEQIYRDHPAYTTFLFLGGVYKFFSIFFDNFTIQEILASKSIDENLQTLFVIARVLNSIYFFLVALILFAILRELNIKKNICVFSTFSIVFLCATYELLFLIRSEILSVLMALLFTYYLIKFIKKKNKISYCFFSGFFFCLAMLAKIQIIFLLFTFLVFLPFLFNYFEISENKNYLIRQRKYYILSLFFLNVLLIGYVIIQLILRISSYNIDLFLLSVFVILYFFFIKFLSVKKIINFSEIFTTISTIFLGYVFCLFFIFFLDLINLIPLNKLILINLIIPIEYMAIFTNKIAEDTNIIITLKDYFYGSLGFFPKIFNTGINTPKIWLIDTRLFFRTTNLIIFIFLIYFFAKKIKNNNLTLLSIVLYLGIVIYGLSFNFRETHGYNIFIFPLYIILASIILNKLEKRFVIIFYLLLSINFLSETISLSDLHKNHFIREPRVYDLCGIEKWKNSENYMENFNKSSYIPLVKKPKRHFKLARFDDRFLTNYCDQMKNKTNF